jgi:hypothetical protein
MDFEIHTIEKIAHICISIDKIWWFMLSELQKSYNFRLNKFDLQMRDTKSLFEPSYSSKPLADNKMVKIEKKPKI